jgi:TM2 domain-containing membrane protein YozV
MTDLQLVKKFPTLYKSEGSLQCSQEPLLTPVRSHLKSASSYPLSVAPIPMLSFHLLLRLRIGQFSWGFLYICMFAVLISPILPVFPTKWYLVKYTDYGSSYYTAWKVKQSHARPWQAQRVPGGGGSQILRQSAHEGGTVFSPTHRSPLPPGNIPGTHFC